MTTHLRKSPSSPQRSRRVAPPRAPRPAFTLLELIIVLSLIGASLAFAWPAMRRTLHKSQLREAAKQVRTQLTQARLSAMETGEAQQFRFQPGTGRFIVAPLTAPVGTDVQASAAAPRATPSESSEADAEPEERPIQDLAEGVVFSGADLQAAYDSSGADEADSDAMQIPPEAEFLEADAALTDDWSAPIVFYPNGRCSTATVRLRGDRDMQVDISLRGVIGTVEVAAPVRSPEHLRR